MAKNQALSDALAVAEEANKAKTAFLSNMSHEIRTPMNAIIGLDNIALSEQGIPETTKGYLEKIGGSAQHLLHLINDILDMSRIESGRMSLKNEEFSISHLLEQINTLVSGQCSEKGIEYRCNINGHIDDYYIGDDMKLRQIILNILSNAVKFTPKDGNVDFTVERVAGFENKSTLRFTVKDTGIGISKAFLPRIFESFSQEDSSATNKYGSSGLGMAITKNMVDMMNGKIEVESEKGKGTTFTVTVTLMDCQRKDAADEPEISVHDMKVLVVDDDPIACEHARLVLEKVGIPADTAMSGAEAVEKVRFQHARREPYNLILVDWKMPDMDGVETTRQIRAIVGNESAIIILTAYRWDDITEEAVAAGVDSFIAKPLFAANVMEEFRQAIKKKNIVSLQKERKAELKGRRVLLAEDVAINAEIVMMLLSMKEIETDHAVNGRIAVEKFAEHPENYYDVILMDIRMPEMDGLDAATTIRDMDRADAKTIPIVALTANAFDEDVQLSLQAGMNAHLSKPTDPEQLFSTLETLIWERENKETTHG
jgi:CheY-like chemotaxis protein